MTARLVLKLWPVVAFLLLLAGAGCGGGSSAPAKPQPYQGTQLTGAASDFHLVDQNGMAVALSSFQGKLVVLAFLDTKCTDICPLTALHFFKTRESLGSDATKVVFLAVNTNLAANSEADLTAATQKWGMNRVSTWHFLTGDAAALQEVWKAYDIFAGEPKPGKLLEVQHTPGVYIIDQAGQKRWYVSIPMEDSDWKGPALSELLTKHIGQLLKERN